MNNSQPTKAGAAVPAGLDLHLPAPPKKRLRDWMRAVDLLKARPPYSHEPIPSGLNGRDQGRRLPIRFFKTNRKRVKVALAEPMSPQ
jgi:hypothetical protein